MSSHREAPEISKDPVADNTDVYAFVSPDSPNTVTLIANFLPFQAPDGGPNFYEFDDDVLYEIHVANSGTSDADITYQFRFTTQVRNPDTFLYNTGPITALGDTTWNRPQTYAVTKVTPAGATILARGVPCPPCNIGPRSTPTYATLAAMAVQRLPSGETVFAGQRADGFYVDVGAIFDLGDLRPFQQLHLLKPAGASASAPGVNSLGNQNVLSIALQVPTTQLTRDGSSPRDPASATAIIGVWAAASRRAVHVRDPRLNLNPHFGRFVQVSRLGNPLFNEVLVPMGRKDLWNAGQPASDAGFLPYVQKPELAGLLPALYPGVFPNLAALNASGAARADLVAILLSGLPPGIVPGFRNDLGPAPADMLRLNMAIPPTPMASANILGLVAGDAAGFPNGRRVFDDVTTVELRAVAGLTYPLVAPSYTPDAAASLVTDFDSTGKGGAPSSSVDPAHPGTGTIPIPPEGFYLPTFPYLGTAYDGFGHPASPAS